MTVIKHGEVYYGPFESREAAVRWAATELEGCLYSFIELAPPRFPDWKN